MPVNLNNEVMAGNALISRFLDSDYPLIIGHRGVSAYYPENTIVSVEAAIRLGCDMVEIDVQSSADDVLLIAHDPDLSRVASRKIDVSELKWSELQKIDVGSWFHPKYSGVHIPTLHQVLEVCRDTIPVNLELKFADRNISRLQIRVKAVVEAVTRFGMQDQVVISSFNSRVSPIVKQQNQSIATAILYHHFYWKNTPPSEIVNQRHADFFHCSWKQHNQKWQKNLDEQRIPVNVYTVNELSAYRKMKELGVSGVFSDRPDVLLDNR